MATPSPLSRIRAAYKADKTPGKGVLPQQAPFQGYYGDYAPSTGNTVVAATPTPAVQPGQMGEREALQKLSAKNRPSSWRPLNPPAVAESTGKAKIRMDDNKDYQAYARAEDRMIAGNGNGSPVLNAVRKAIPLPDNAKGYVLKKVLKRNEMDDNTLSRGQRSVMYKVIQNAIKRTGKLSGGTEYEDYKGVVSDANYAEIEKAKKGEINPINGALLGATSQGYNMATTLGRVSYAVNPYTNEAILTDGYDFTNNYTQGKDGKLKKDYMKGKTDQYSLIRKSLAEEDQGQSEATKRRFFVGTRLSPKDTLGMRPLRPL